VEINGIVSSCKNNTCAYNYTEVKTSILKSITPEEGKEGDVVSIECEGCSGNVGDDQVFVGDAECQVNAVIGERITCVLGWTFNNNNFLYEK